jgi:hypothetical protein
MRNAEFGTRNVERQRAMGLEKEALGEREA